MKNKKTQLKFTIQSRLDNLPHEAAKSIIPTLHQQLGISRMQFYRIRNTPIDSDYEPSADILIKLSGLFGCKPEDLYFKPVEKLTLSGVDVQKLGLSK